MLRDHLKTFPIKLKDVLGIIVDVNFTRNRYRWLYRNHSWSSSISGKLQGKMPIEAEVQNKSLEEMHWTNSYPEK